MRKKILLLLPVLLCMYGNSIAQQTTPSRLKVFVDCHSGCDMTYIRSEINIVDFVLDRIAGDVHVLITDQNTGSGGDQYQLIFFGQNQFKNNGDTIYFDNDANNTDFEERELLIKYLKLGLAPYIAKTKMAQYISIGMKIDNADNEVKKDTMAQTKDPWNYWVFRTSLNGYVSAEEAYTTSSLNGGFSVNRVTEELKTGLEINGGKNKSIYRFDDDNGVPQKLTIRNDNYEVSHFLVKSLTNHWSLGYEAKISRSSFSNNKMQSLLRSGIEYNIYPYKQVNTKYFTISYVLDLRRNIYFDTTLYDKTKETLAGHSVESNFTFNQKWGTIECGLEYHNYFHNWKLLNLQANVELIIRITGGLSFNLYTSAELIRDQIYLPKEGASSQEVLTRRRQIASGYQLFTHFGISYRFGSKLNNFVNPRFGI